MSRPLGLIAVLVVALLGLTPPPSLAGTPPAASAIPPLAAPAPGKTEAPAAPAAEAGFRVTSVEVAAERDAPQACFVFSDRLGKIQGPGYAAFVDVDPKPATVNVVARDNTLCVEGLAHAAAYAITLREGLPGAGGARLAAAERHEIAVPNRAPSLAFRGAGYILPRVGAEGLPLRAINVDRARLRVLRMADRALVEKIYAGRVSQTLSDWDIGELVEKAGQVAWSGDLSIKANPNIPVVTPFPIESALGGLERGVYLAIAEPAAVPTAKTVPGRESRASQWFVVSDLGLTSFVGDGGLMVFARSLASVEPAAGVELHLLARNGKELAKRVTGDDGIARFEAEVARRDGDDAAQALFAYGAAGDFNFLDLAAPGFDLTDRGAGGRAAPGPLDGFLYTDRGVYRPGETVNLTALLRDDRALAVTGRPILLKLWRPDGFEAGRRQVADAGAGGYTAAFALPAVALSGTWTLTAHLDADGPAIGKAEVSVLDFVPPRLEVSLAANRPALGADAGLSLSIEGRYLFGAPAAGLPGELSLTVRPAEEPFPGHAGFQFGLVQEKLAPAPVDLPGFTTSAAGKATVEVPVIKPPESSHPLEAVVRGTIVDVGGRPVSRELILPVQHQPFAIGVRPRFDDGAVPEGATAGFDVIAVAADGAPLDKADLSYEVYEEDHEYRWFESNGRWDYETVIHDRRVTGGAVSVKTDAPAGIEEPVGAGSYRLEVFDSKTNVATSVRFAAGWWVTPNAGSRPDKVEVTVMPRPYQGGETARVHIRPPYDSEVLIAVADRAIRQTMVRRIPAQGAFLDIPVDPSWTAGATIIATAYAPIDPANKTPPHRAIGVGWLAVDAAPHTLDVKLEAPASIEPRQSAAVRVAVRDATGAPLPPGMPAWLTLSAVDDAVLQASDQATPDPAAYYLGQRRLGVELRDDYGRLLEAGGAGKAASRSAPPEKKRLRQLPGLPERDSPVVSLFSGVVPVGADGAASVPIALPDFDGRLRLVAVAWTAGAVGHAEAVLTVRDRVATTLALPRFLAPGDHARIDLTLVNVAGTAGDYQVTLTAGGGVSLADGAFTVAVPKRGRHVSVSRQLIGEATGAGTITLEIAGPDGFRLTRTRTLRVRPIEPSVWRHGMATLAPGQTAEWPAALAAGLRPESVAASLSLGALSEFDLAGLVMTVDRPLKGSTEQLTSGILRLIAGRDAAIALGIDGEASLRERVQVALDRLLSLQRADGGFSQWSPKADADPWLTPFVADTLARARAAGFQVPDGALRLCQDWLKRTLDNGWIEDRDLPSRAYATWLLARAKALDVGAVQYFLETYGAKLPTDLPRAQLAAALAALGDAHGAGEAFDRLAARSAGGASVLDLAGIIALGGESGALGGERLIALADKLASRLEGPDVRLSVAEKAWLALAARALADHAAPEPPARIAVDGKVIDTIRPVYRRLIDPATAPGLGNAGSEPLHQVVTVIGPPAEPQDAAEHGFTINRSIFDMEGKPVKPEEIRRNELLVVILDGGETEPLRQQALVTDLLPAGLDIENVRLANSAQLGALSWLGDLSPARHIEFRNDRFVAALDLDETHPRFRLVYLARAMTPGDFAQAAATVESTAAPARFARTATGRAHVLADKE